MISDRFVELREKGRTAAWSEVQKQVMGNAGLLVPEVVTLKDLVAVGLEIENFLKTEQGISTADPLEETRKWLNGETAILLQ